MADAPESVRPRRKRRRRRNARSPPGSPEAKRTQTARSEGTLDCLDVSAIQTSNDSQQGHTGSLQLSDVDWDVSFGEAADQSSRLSEPAADLNDTLELPVIRPRPRPGPPRASTPEHSPTRVTGREQPGEQNVANEADVSRRDGTDGFPEMSDEEIAQIIALGDETLGQMLESFTEERIAVEPEPIAREVPPNAIQATSRQWCLERLNQRRAQNNKDPVTEEKGVYVFFGPRSDVPLAERPTMLCQERGCNARKITGNSMGNHLETEHQLVEGRDFTLYCGYCGEDWWKRGIDAHTTKCCVTKRYGPQPQMKWACHCGRAFQSQLGLGQHQRQTHGRITVAVDNLDTEILRARRAGEVDDSDCSWTTRTRILLACILWRLKQDPKNKGEVPRFYTKYAQRVFYSMGYLYNLRQIRNLRTYKWFKDDILEPVEALLERHRGEDVTEMDLHDSFIERVRVNEDLNKTVAVFHAKEREFIAREARTQRTFRVRKLKAPLAPVAEEEEEDPIEPPPEVPEIEVRAEPPPPANLVQADQNAAQTADEADAEATGIMGITQPRNSPTRRLTQTSNEAEQTLVPVTPLNALKSSLTELSNRWRENGASGLEAIVFDVIMLILEMDQDGDTTPESAAGVVERLNEVFLEKLTPMESRDPDAVTEEAPDENADVGRGAANPRREKPAGAQPEAENRNRKKAREFKRLAQLWESNKKRLAEVVLDEATTQRCQIPTTEVEAHYSAVWGDPPQEVDVEQLPPPDPVAMETAKPQIDSLYAPITPEEVKDAVKRINDGSAAGPDGLTSSLLKKVGTDFPEAFVGMFNIWMFLKVSPRSLKASRTVLLPKKPEAGLEIRNWRPISIGSVLSRCMASILARRLRKAIPLHPSQRGFVDTAGCEENTWILQALMERARNVRRKSPMVAVFLDLAKAFDTVPHPLIMASLKRFAVPTELLDFVEDWYNPALTTIETASSVTSQIQLKRGTKQGCPLSPILFNVAMDSIFCELAKTNLGIPVGPARLPALAFADDTACLAGSSRSAEKLAEKVNSRLTSWSMNLNEGKSKAVAIGPEQNNANRVGLNGSVDRQPKLKGTALEWIPHGNEQGTSTAFRYLGTEVLPYAAIRTKNTVHALKTWLKNVEKAALKPLRKLWIVRHVVVARLIWLARSEKPTRIAELDGLVRNAVKRILHLPPGTVDALFYVRASMGGVGLPYLGSVIPNAQCRIRLRLRDHRDKHIRDLAAHLGIDKDLEKQKSPGPQFWPDKWREKPTHGHGADTWLQHPCAQSYRFTFNSAEQILTLKMRANVLPVRANLQRGDRVEGNPAAMCRRCKDSVESQSHVLNDCPFGQKQRVVRHNRLVSLVEREINRESHAEKGWIAIREPVLRPKETGLEKNLVPDLFVINRTLGVSVILDPCVVYEKETRALREANDRKRRKYAVLETWAKKTTGTQAFSAYGVAVGSRGGWCKSSLTGLKAVGLRGHQLKRLTRALTTAALSGSIYCVKYHIGQHVDAIAGGDTGYVCNAPRLPIEKRVPPPVRLLLTKAQRRRQAKRNALLTRTGKKNATGSRGPGRKRKR